MEGREAKGPTFIKSETVNREKEFIKLQDRKIHWGESQKPRVRNNLTARIFCMILFAEKNWLFSRLRKGVVRATLPRNMKDVCIGEWYGLWNLQKEEKTWKHFCTHGKHLSFFVSKRNISWSQMWPNISAGHATDTLMKSRWKEGEIA